MERQKLANASVKVWAGLARWSLLHEPSLHRHTTPILSMSSACTSSSMAPCSSTTVTLHRTAKQSPFRNLEPPPFEGTGADEPGEAPGLARLEGGNLQALPVPAPERQQRPLVDQLELDLGMDGGARPRVGEGQVQRDEAGVLLVRPVQVAADLPGVAAGPELAGQEGAAVVAARVLEPRVALHLEHVVPGADRPRDDAGHGHLLREQRADQVIVLGTGS